MAMLAGIWRSGFPGGRLVAALLAAGLAVAGVVRGEDYQSADEAFAAGAKQYNARNYVASQEPFEAALKLAPDDNYRVKVYRALIPAYRQLPEIDKMIEALEFIIEHTSIPAEASNMRTQLKSFVQQRGKVDAAVERYEQALKNDAHDKTALYLLSQIEGDLRRNPQRSAELTERLIKVLEDERQPVDVQTSAYLAMQYVRAGQLKEGAELYEQIAPKDAKLSAWHLKEAATAWLQAGEKQRALEAARKSLASAPETRSEQLEFFWHKALGDVFLPTGEPKLAAEQYELALTKTTIEGYRKTCQEKLDEARKALQ